MIAQRERPRRTRLIFFGGITGGHIERIAGRFLEKPRGSPADGMLATVLEVRET